jgi:rare lipoprotein A
MLKTLATATLLTTLMPIVSAAHARPGSSQTQTGVASYYHDSLHGHKTASGQRYNKNRFTAAHKTLPLGTQIQVTDTLTGRSIVVKVNDRGPFVKGRILDLSREAADELGMIKKGVADIELKVMSTPQHHDS